MHLNTLKLKIQNITLNHTHTNFHAHINKKGNKLKPIPDITKRHTIHYEQPTMKYKSK